MSDEAEKPADLTPAYEALLNKASAHKELGARCLDEGKCTESEHHFNVTTACLRAVQLITEYNK
jgi:hypothetical protein